MSMDAKEFECVLHLTETEYHVFLAMGRGLTTKEISRIEGRRLSCKTVESHQQNMRYKLNLLDICKLRTLATRYILYTEMYNITRRQKSNPSIIRYEFCNKLAA
jgi:DNA-binding NarL/FixJ family response regulator